MARLGLALSILGIVVSLGLAIYFSSRNRHAMQDMVDQVDRSFQSWQGVVAPDLAVTTLDGQSLRLGDLKGKRVILDVWATWCPACLQEIPDLMKLYGETKRDDLMIVGISREDAQTLANFIQKNPINYPIASVSNLPAPYSQDILLPTTYFIDRQGIIQSITIGYYNDADLKAHALTTDYQGPPKPAPANWQAILPHPNP